MVLRGRHFRLAQREDQSAITTALASPTKPVSDIDARRLGRRKRELALAHRTGGRNGATQPWRFSWMSSNT